MILIRIALENKPVYATIENNKARLINGDFFGRWSLSDKFIDIDKVTFLPPVEPYQIIGIGLNYHDHAQESKITLPKEPAVFIKGTNSIIGHKQAIVLPKIAPNEVDYEAELVIVMGSKAKNVSVDDAHKYILGYTCGNDVSARDCQLKRDIQWARGKSFDTFAPIGPAIVTDIIPDRLNISLKLNGKLMQSSNTEDMIFNSRQIVSFLSSCMTLYPKTIIMTGTPSGIGAMRTPPVYLKQRDVVTVEIEKIGLLRNYVEIEQ